MKFRRIFLQQAKAETDWREKEERASTSGTFDTDLSNRGRFPCFHSLIKTRGGAGRIRDSYANPRRSQGFA